MIKEHIPSCPVSRKWRGEKSNHIVYLDAHTNERLLEEFGFVKRSRYYWSGLLTPEQAEGLRSRSKCLTFSSACICYNPTLSEKGNIEWNRVWTRKELAEGWGPGYKEPGSLGQEGEETSGSGWGQWLLALVGMGQTNKEPEPDPTLDPNWQPEYC